jgi:hypothetical protein
MTFMNERALGWLTGAGMAGFTAATQIHFAFAIPALGCILVYILVPRIHDDGET